MGSILGSPNFRKLPYNSYPTKRIMDLSGTKTLRMSLEIDEESLSSLKAQDPTPQHANALHKTWCMNTKLLKLEPRLHNELLSAKRSSNPVKPVSGVRWSSKRPPHEVQKPPKKGQNLAGTSRVLPVHFKGFLRLGNSLARSSEILGRTFLQHPQASGHVLSKLRLAGGAGSSARLGLTHLSH